MLLLRSGYARIPPLILLFLSLVSHQHLAPCCPCFHYPAFSLCRPFLLPAFFLTRQPSHGATANSTLRPRFWSFHSYTCSQVVGDPLHYNNIILKFTKCLCNCRTKILGDLSKPGCIFLIKMTHD